MRAKRRALDGLSYRQAQQRNSTLFRGLSSILQKELRARGYRNSGWDNVLKSWYLLLEFTNLCQTDSNVIDIATFAEQKAEVNYTKAKEAGDLILILEAGKALISAMKLKYQ